MRKISFLLACILIFGVFASGAAVFADSDDAEAFAYYVEADSENCMVDENGTLVSFSGKYGMVLFIPASIGDKKITKIGDGAFAGTPVLSVYAEEGITEIGKGAFEGSNIEYIGLPSTVQKIGENAFKDCGSLYSLSFSDDGAEFGKDALAGTEFLYISVLCSFDTDAFNDKIKTAKGDENFWFDVMHTNIVESMFEKDVYGNNLVYCEDCGVEYRGCDDIELQFEDVPKGAWYYPYVVTAYEFGIMNGKSDTIFDPKGNITIAELVKIAACVHLYQQDEEYEFAGNPETWYQPYLDYCYEKGIIEKNVVFNWEKDATRAEMAYLFSRADDGYYVPNDDVPLSDIPDVDENMAFALNILALYRRGIAVGSNEYYAFYPEAKLKRSEAAAIVSRILCYDMRTLLPKG